MRTPPEAAASPEVAPAGRLRLAARTSWQAGSLTRRMIGTAAFWIVILLLGGGVGLDRVLTAAVTRNFDSQLGYVMTAMMAAAEIGPQGEVRFNRSLGDQRFLEPYSGLYWQVSTPGQEPFRSRSLWDRAMKTLKNTDLDLHVYDSDMFPKEPLRVLEQNVVLPGSQTPFRFQVAQSRVGLNAQIAALRATLVRSFAILGIGLILMSGLQTVYGLWPLRRVRRAIVDVRSGVADRVEARTLPVEIRPLVDELNALLAHNEQQAEEARRHAGNLAHALKTPLTVINNAVTAQDPALGEIVVREAQAMRRQVDHHLARARAVGRRASGQARTPVWPSLEAVERAVARMFEDRVTIDLAGDRSAVARVERQDLEEMAGNLIENAAKYGGDRVFVTVSREPGSGPADSGFVDIIVEDEGPGIPKSDRARIFERGARLDTGKPGTGLGLAIVRDVVQIYGGSVSLEESEDLGGLLVRLRLPAAA